MSRRVPGCWACEEPWSQPPPGVPRDVITWYLIALHQLLGHAKAEAVVLGGQPASPIVTVQPAARYL